MPRLLFLVAILVTAILPAWAEDPTSVETQLGLHTATVKLAGGSVVVHLPDDLSAGDTISGTVRVEPSGEAAEASDELRGVVVEFGEKSTPADQGRQTWQIPPQAPERLPLLVRDRHGRELGRCEIPVGHSQAGRTPEPLIPEWAQAGKPFSVPGAYDGDSSSTRVLLAGLPAEVLAESPRQAVVRNPAGNVGPLEVEVQEGGRTVVRGRTRSLAIRLAADRLDLRKGEQTTLYLRVLGLEGLQAPATVRLANLTPAIVGLEGGDVQQVEIPPAQVKPDGTYATQRKVVARQAGRFTVQALVLALWERPWATLPGGGGSSPHPSPARSFVYVTGGRGVYGFALDHASGLLSPLPGSPYAAGDGPKEISAFTGGGHTFVYAVNQRSNNVSGYSVTPGTGVLTQVPGSPFAVPAAGLPLSLDASSGAVYVPVPEADRLAAWRIEPATGSLTPVRGSPFSTPPGPRIVVAETDGSRVFVLNTGSNTLSSFVRGTSGALTAGPGSPFPTSVPGGTPVSGAFEGHLYVAFSGPGGTIGRYIFGADGGLVTFADTRDPLGPNPTCLRSRNMLTYLAHRATPGTVAGFAQDGLRALSALDGSPYAAGADPVALGIQPAGLFVVVANATSRDVEVYRCNPNPDFFIRGSLTRIPGSAQTVPDPQSLVVVGP